jgi:ABC-type multidrug transport system fused ATPase/permease subunit
MIDYATDKKFQRVIRNTEATNIAIAHRPRTIIGFDKVLVLEVTEFDHPWVLLQRKDRGFRGMCDMNGNLDQLDEIAKPT